MKTILYYLIGTILMVGAIEFAIRAALAALTHS